MGARSATAAFTVLDVLVVVLLCLFLMVVLPPVLRGPIGGGAFRMTCGTNLSGLGKAMLIYANDYDDEFPRAGGRTTSWAARTPDWMGANHVSAFTGHRASVSASLYLLVKYAEVEPERFVCTNDVGVTKWAFSREKHVPRGAESIDFWDFGPEPPRHVSYAYHYPFGMYALTTSSEPGLAVAADRNPWMDSPFVKARDFSKFKPATDARQAARGQFAAGNSLTHKGEGQNVVFLDTHVEFTKWPNCGLEEDNIYTSWDGDDKLRGKPAAFGSEPADRRDSFLVNDPAVLRP